MNIPENAVFVLVNDDAGADVDAVLDPIAAAIDHVLRNSFRAAWGGSYSCVASPAGPARAANEVPVHMRASSDIQGAAGYHDDGGIYCFRDGLPSLTIGAFAYSVVISHEIFEAAGDPGANRWADNGNGLEMALELCDAVEGFYFVPAGFAAAVSDFLLPSFFDPGGVKPFSRLDKPTAPLSTTADSGADYQIVRSVDENGAKQVTATKPFRLERRSAKAHPSSRSSRRGVRIPSV